MKFTYSAGPWFFGEENATGTIVELDAPDHEGIASVVTNMADDEGFFSEASRRMRGNAQIIRHSLQLYELLKQLQDSLDVTSRAYESVTNLLESVEGPTFKEMSEILKNRLFSALVDPVTRYNFVHERINKMHPAEIEKAYKEGL